MSFVFFFKQKTAYEMRISDGSSDVCSSDLDPAVPFIFVDTLKMFPETLEYRETLISTFGIENSWVVTPDPDVLASKDDKGLRWSYDPDGCCEIRKVEPLARAKKGLDSWISGRKAFQ